MKFNKISVFVVAMLMAGTLSFSASRNKGETLIDGGKRIIVDFQGAEWGKECPKWVETLNDGSAADVAKALKINTKEDTVFIAEGRASDLDFAQAWVENIEARQKVASAISQVIATDTQAIMEGQEGRTLSENEKERIFKNSTAMASAIELNGLEQVAKFWTKTIRLKPGVKLKANKSYPEKDILASEYSYYVVYKMETKRFEDQLDAAMKTVDDNTSEQAYLKRVLAAKVGQSIYPGNNIDPAFLIVDTGKKE